MRLPTLLLIFAVLIAAVPAYGVESAWGYFGHRGVSVILWSRRLQWPAVGLSLLLCLGLLSLVAAGRRAGWWTIGLLPVMAVMLHLFFTGGHPKPLVDVTMVEAAQAPAIAPTDKVIGFVVDGVPYAVPYSVANAHPVVTLITRQGPVVLIWSPYANRALVFKAERDFRGRDLEIVASPVNATIVYNSRLGQFINGVTALTSDGQRPTGLDLPLMTRKVTWAVWSKANPLTLLPTVAGTGFTGEQRPRYGVRGDANVLSDTRGMFIADSPTPLIGFSQGVGPTPVNVDAASMPIVLVRVNGQLRAFDRRVPGNAATRFELKNDPKRVAVAMEDSVTQSSWSAGGIWLEGATGVRGKALVPVLVEDDVYRGPVDFWITNRTELNDVRVPTTRPTSTTKPATQPVDRTRRVRTRR